MRQLGVLNRGGIPMLPGHGGGGRVYSGAAIGPYGPVDNGGDALPVRRGGIPAGYGPAAGVPASSGDPMDPSSSNFDPSARTPTQSSFNFRQSVLNNNALAKARTAMAAQVRATQRAQAGVQGPAEMAAAAQTGGMPTLGTNGDYGGETANPASIGAPAPAVGGGMPMLNPYAGGQGPGTTLYQRPITTQHAADSVVSDSNGGIPRSGLPLQAFADRRLAMDHGPGRIHAVLPPDMAANLAENGAGRMLTSTSPGGDTVQRTGVHAYGGGPAGPIRLGGPVVDRYVGPGIPAGYGPQDQARDMATATYGEAQAAGQMQLAGNPDPAARAAGLDLASAQAEGARANAAGAVQDARENATLREQNRLLLTEGAKGGAAENDPRRRATLINAYTNAIRNSRGPAKDVATEKLLTLLEQDQTGGASPNGGTPAPPVAPTPAGGGGNLPRVNSPEEAKKLPSGTQFIDPSGVVRRVP